METGSVAKVLFFASLREQAQCDQLEVSLEDGTTVAELKARLCENNERLKQALNGKVLAAVDQEMVADTFCIPSDAEVAFFPPVTGG